MLKENKTIFIFEKIKIMLLGFYSIHPLSLSLSLSIYIYIYIYTHTHTLSFNLYLFFFCLPPPPPLPFLVCRHPFIGEVSIQILFYNGYAWFRLLKIGWIWTKNLLSAGNFHVLENGSGYDRLCKWGNWMTIRCWIH